MAPPAQVSLTGTHATAIEGAKGDKRIYYQADDGSLHERRGQGPAAFGNSYSASRRILPAGVARMGTPLAAVTWGDTQAGKFNEIRLYYIAAAEDHVRELESNDFSEAWSPGIFDQRKYRAAPGSSLLYATCIPGAVNPGSPRVGFQSAEHPTAITEASWVNGWHEALLQ